MPRTGGVYSPPAGTKGVAGTTIQSSPYNTWVDDLTADANAARPITAGGTGSTSASGARTALGLGTAAVKNTGTSGDAVPLLNGTNTWSGVQTVTANQGLVLNASSPTFRLIDADTGAEAHLSASSAVGSVGLNADVTSVGSSPNLNFDIRSVNKMSISETTATVRVDIGLTADKAISFAGTGAATTRTNLGLGTAATQNTGTSGANVPLMNAANTWSQRQRFSGGIGFSNDDDVSFNDATNTYFFASDGTVPGTILEFGKARLVDGNDASLSSTAHAFQIGDTAGLNIIADNNEIMARNNGATSPLILQGDGGAVEIGPGGLTTSGNVAAGRYVTVSDTSAPEYTLQAGGVRVARVWFDTTADTLYMRRYVQGTGANSGVIEIRGGGADDFKYNGSTVYHAGNSGTAATKNIGTSGANVPLLSTSNTWSASQLLSNGTSYIRLGLERSGMTASLEALSNPALQLGTETNHDVILKRNSSAVASFGGSAMAMASNYAISFAGTGAATTRTNLGLGGLAVLDQTDLVYTGSSDTNTNFPIGTVLWVLRAGAAFIARNASSSVYLSATDTSAFTRASGGSQLSGTWRLRGSDAAGASAMCIFERTA